MKTGGTFEVPVERSKFWPDVWKTENQKLEFEAQKRASQNFSSKQNWCFEYKHSYSGVKHSKYYWKADKNDQKYFFFKFSQNHIKSYQIQIKLYKIIIFYMLFFISGIQKTLFFICLFIFDMTHFGTKFGPNCCRRPPALRF